MLSGFPTNSNIRNYSQIETMRIWIQSSKEIGISIRRALRILHNKGRNLLRTILLFRCGLYKVSWRGWVSSGTISQSLPFCGLKRPVSSRGKTRRWHPTICAIERSLRVPSGPLWLDRIQTLYTSPHLLRSRYLPYHMYCELLWVPKNLCSLCEVITKCIFIVAYRMVAIFDTCNSQRSIRTSGFK